MKRTLVLLLAACALPGGEVISKSEQPTAITACDGNFKSPAVGDLCTLTDVCLTKLTPCCTEKILCSGGAVTVVSRDCNDCPACDDDSTCVELSWCTEQRCQPCPEATGCPECPAGQNLKLRKGCKTCDCE